MIKKFNVKVYLNLIILKNKHIYICQIKLKNFLIYNNKILSFYKDVDN